MKKFFLIPLMTVLCTVMAWAVEDVATKDQLQAALNAGGDIRLTSTINLGPSQVTMTSGTATLDLNGCSLTSTYGGYGADKGALNVSGGHLTINATNGGSLSNTGSESCGIVVADGANLTINGGTIHGGYESIYTDGANIVINDGAFTTGTPYDNCIWTKQNETYPTRIVIKGGTFTGSTGWRCFQIEAGTELIIEGGTYIGQPNIFWAADPNSITITGGVFNQDPTKYVVWEEALMSVTDGIYTVTKDITGGAYLLDTYTVYSSLQAAVDAANAGSHIMVLAANQSATVGKSLTFELGEYSANITAASGFQKSVNGDFVSIMAEGSLGAYLNGDSEDPFEITANIDLSAQGLVKVKGTKKITVNSGKTITTAYKVRYPQIRVPNGAKLTVEGDGTITGDRGQFLVEKGGELVIGKADKSDQLNITSSFNSVVNFVVTNYGKTTINKAEIHAKSAVVNNWGTMDILGGLYTGEASNAEKAHQYCIVSDNGSQMTLKNSIVKGVHGAVCTQGLDASQKGGNIRIEDCELIATSNPNGTTSSGDVHYALYSATGGTASVYNTKMKSTGKDQAIHIGNNDAFNTFGLVYVYEGCVIKAPKGKRIWVQKRTALDKEVLFPISVDQDSKWYNAAMKGGEGPLPVGYEYYAILDNDGSRTGSDTIDTSDPENKKIYSHALHAAGYTWKVFSTATEKQEATGATIPWQQNTTWTDTDLGDVVPAATTAVTIPEGKTVVVSNAEENKNAVAEQLQIGRGASLTVQEGTTLAIGEGGINIADGGQLIVEDKAIVTVGEAGIVTANENAIVIKSDAAGTGAFLIHPAVKENTRPAATVEMYAKAHKVGGNWFPQHCGIPTVGAPESIIFPAGGATYMDKFVADGANPWEAVTSISDLEPFVGYRLNFSGASEAGVYTFKGNLQGNGDAPLQFVKPYYNLLANSYTSPMDIEALFNGLTTQYGDDVDLTLWVYNSTYNRHEVVSKLDIEESSAAFTTIAPMQGYILYCGPTQATAGSIDYESTIWNCAQKIGVPILAPARNVNDGRIRATIVVTSATSSDKVVLREAGNYSNAFENGADARKYMSENVFNIYSTNNGEAFSQIATDNLMGTAITVKAANETAYTLSFSNVQNFNYAIRDNLSGAIIPVEEGMTYEFTMNEGATAEGRFEVVERYNTPTGVENIEAARSAKGIYTVLGQYIGESSLLNTLPTGIYVVDGQRIVK